MENKYLRVGLYICICLFFIAFINNVITTFDDLKLINQEEDIITFYEMSDFTVKNEKFKKERLIYKYIIYFIFFYNLDHPERIIYY